MESLAGDSICLRLCHRWRISQISILSNRRHITLYLIFLPPSCGTQCFSSGTGSAHAEFPRKNAYELLGVPETSSFAEIKASFRKLAKETHPDLAESKNDSAASHRFVQILAAYEILSDSEKRAHYDRYLLSQKNFIKMHTAHGSRLNTYKSHATKFKEMEVVEWLKWYRLAINDILSEKKVVVGTGYFDVLETDFYSAIHAAYYGPEIEGMELLPDCFEAEERSAYETPEVLHLVSGRDLFGMVRLASKMPEISSAVNKKLTFFRSMGSGLCQSMKNVSIHKNLEAMDDFEVPLVQAFSMSNKTSDAYSDLELHLSGKVVAVATRVPPKTYSNWMQKEDAEDHIHVYLNSHGDPKHEGDGFSGCCFAGGAVGTRIPLGTITGLGTSPEEGSCFVYNSSGMKTHVIMKHRTLLVKHLHWYQVGEEVSVCECRCTRARLPPSKFWLFEPRCGLHDIGGWYVETYGNDKKGRTISSQRFWDGFDASEKLDRRLHPAMYLLSLAYRTLDLEDAKIRKRTLRNVLEGQLFKILHWCKKLV
ncbi:Chaperone protein DnaJ [Quillaja saponaria]|uniref:Chaperone protein DnaJ n=1 Tax=Quillaja saponaria TaxID=32244 RepID=A0AAD7KRK3_QUISA|nr:Chaperone protein DnaJ [Quillaja saponaria]KAJ7944496.1 Chaperone protein DnaJ [Quillaja saponaria]